MGSSCSKSGRIQQIAENVHLGINAGKQKVKDAQLSTLGVTCVLSFVDQSWSDEYITHRIPSITSQSDLASIYKQCFDFLEANKSSQIFICTDLPVDEAAALCCAYLIHACAMVIEDALAAVNKQAKFVASARHRAAFQQLLAAKSQPRADSKQISDASVNTVIGSEHVTLQDNSSDPDPGETQQSEPQPKLSQGPDTQPTESAVSGPEASRVPIEHKAAVTQDTRKIVEVEPKEKTTSDSKFLTNAKIRALDLSTAELQAAYVSACNQLPDCDPSRYELKREISKTLFGSVWIATDTEMDETVIIKRSELDRRPSYSVESPEDEIKYLTVLGHNFGHTNVIRGLASMRVDNKIIRTENKKMIVEDKSSAEDNDVIQLNNEIWTVLEFGGEELFNAITNGPSQSLATVKKYFYNLMKGLKHMHSRRLCHLDLSPENCLVDATGTGDLKIIDLGQARFINYGEDGRPVKFTCPPKPGKVSYKAPEINLGQDFDGEAADIWSCGVILFVMLAGAPPFEIAMPSDMRFKLIFRGQIHRLIQAWRLQSRFPDAAMKILTGILAPASRRWTVDMILSHLWFADLLE